MNSICFLSSEITNENQISFTDNKRIDHLNQHLKAKIGDSLKITIIDVGIFQATLTEISKDSAALEIGKELPANIGHYNLAIALSRPPTIKKILEHATTLGVKSFHLFKGELSEKSYLQSKIYENHKYHDFMIDGLSQSKTYFKLPSFDLSKFLNFISFEQYSNKYFLSLNSSKTFMQLEQSELLDPLLAIGPERGWTTKEEKELIKNGFVAIGISDSTLRVEHAVFTSLGQLEMLRINANTCN